MKNIFASINWMDEIKGMGLESDKYLAVRLRAFFQYGLNKGMDSDAALSYAKDRLKVNLEKTPYQPKVVDEKRSVKGRPKKEKTSLSEDEILDSRISTVKPEVRRIIDSKLREIVGDVSAEEFKKVQNLFFKSSCELTRSRILI
jgi:hypothetical protein